MQDQDGNGQEQQPAEGVTPPVQDNAAPQDADKTALPALPRPLREHINEPLTAEGNTYLHELCRQKAAPALIIEAVRDLGAIPDLPNRHGLPALAMAIAEGDVDTALCLRALGASIVTGKFNAIVYAVDTYKTDVLHGLLRGARGEGVNQGGILKDNSVTTDTPLLLAIDNHRNDMAALLLAQGSLTGARREKDGLDAVLLAADRHDGTLMAMLMRNGGDIYVRDTQGQTPLHIAATKGRTAVVQTLIDAGIAVDLPAKNGATALLCAVNANKIECVKALIAAGADVNVRHPAQMNETALHLAARGAHDEVAVELLAAGADPLAENDSKMTASQLVPPQHGDLRNVIKAEEEYSLRNHFEKAHRKIVDAQPKAAPKAPVAPHDPNSQAGNPYGFRRW